MSDFDVLAIRYGDPDAGAQFAKSLRNTGFAILMIIRSPGRNRRDV